MQTIIYHGLMCPKFISKERKSRERTKLEREERIFIRKVLDEKYVYVTSWKNEYLLLMI